MSYPSLHRAPFAQRKLPTSLLSLLKAAAIILMMTTAYGCGQESDTDTDTDTDVDDEVVAEQSTNNGVHVAFAGGGWRAHTGHSAWVMSLLDANTSNCTLSSTSGNPTCLADAFTNVKTVSGNSGGSWFSSMLMYDPDFINEITSNEAVQNWGSTDSSNPNQGWLGKQQNYFQQFNSSCGSKTGAAYLKCVLEEYYSPYPIDPVPDWSLLVEDLVYKGYDWQSYGNLGENKRQPWAKEKSFMMAGTWLTNTIVLNDDSSLEEEVYYQVCISPNVVNMEGDDGGSCLDQPGGGTVSIPDVLPVTFSSLAENNSSLKAPSFISNEPAAFNLGYSSAYALFGDTKNNTLQSGSNKTDNVPVMWAAAASSAATGFSASYRIPINCGKLITRWDCAFHLRNLALAFNVPNNSNQVDFVANASVDGQDLEQLNNNRMFRIADGGAVDNSGVAQLVGYLQLNSLDTNFQVIAFDDVQSDDAGNNSAKSKYPSSDISYMFNGAPAAGVCFMNDCVQVPELAILEANPSATTPITKHTWTVVNSAGATTTDSLHYYIYDVQTLQNTSFNIAKGSKGTLHVFASDFSKANTAPENEDDFTYYNDMIQNFGPTLAKKPNNGTSDKTGLELLSQAFGI